MYLHSDLVSFDARRGEGNAPSHELVEDVHNLLDVVGVDGLSSRANHREGALGGSIINETSTGSEQSADEEDLKELLLVLAVVELWEMRHVSSGPRACNTSITHLIA